MHSDHNFFGFFIFPFICKWWLGNIFCFFCIWTTFWSWSLKNKITFIAVNLSMYVRSISIHIVTVTSDGLGFQKSGSRLKSWKRFPSCCHFQWFFKSTKSSQMSKIWQKTKKILVQTPTPNYFFSLFHCTVAWITASLS